MIPQHANKSVVQHEIAHSIDSYYRNGNMPPGSGGGHSLWNCYNNGLALTEGFGNFISHWVQLASNATNTTLPAYNMNIETLPAAVCDGQTNEMQVAAALWDMYDLWNDGPDSSSEFDSLLYTNPGAIVAIYLGHKKNKMSDYLAVVQSGQSTYWQDEFEKLFRLNTIIP